MAISWRCTMCGQCCKAYTPFVLPQDVQRIQQALDLPIHDFVTFYSPFDFEVELNDVDLRYVFQSSTGLRVMCLARRLLDNGEAGCMFLKDNLCSIHSLRPYVCHLYPFEPGAFLSAEVPFRLKEDPCFGRHATDETVDEGPVRSNYQIFQDAQEKYFTLVEEWNSRPESSTREIDEFLAFVGLRWE